jgi:hypothetical protein
MIRHCVPVLALAELFAVTGPGCGQPPRGAMRDEQAAAKYGWLSGLEEGKAQARKTGQPLMVVLRCVP